jgi:serine/threonine protein kinase
MKNFQILNKLGISFISLNLLNSNLIIIGEGAFSTVFKVRRLSDSKEYALKKVSVNI